MDAAIVYQQVLEKSIDQGWKLEKFSPLFVKYFIRVYKVFGYRYQAPTCFGFHAELCLWAVTNKCYERLMLRHTVDSSPLQALQRSVYIRCIFTSISSIVLPLSHLDQCYGFEGIDFILLLDMAQVKSTHSGSLPESLETIVSTIARRFLFFWSQMYAGLWFQVMPYR